MKILVLRNEYAVVATRQLPHRRIGEPPAPSDRICRDSGKRSRSSVIRSSDNCSSKRRRTRSGGRNPQGTAFAFRRIGQTRPDVFPAQLREFDHELVFGHSACEVPENVANGDPSSSNARLPEPEGRINADAIKSAHGASLRQPHANCKSVKFRVAGCAGYERRRMGIPISVASRAPTVATPTQP